MSPEEKAAQSRNAERIRTARTVSNLTGVSNSQLRRALRQADRRGTEIQRQSDFARGASMPPKIESSTTKMEPIVREVPGDDQRNTKQSTTGGEPYLLALSVNGEAGYGYFLNQGGVTLV